MPRKPFNQSHASDLDDWDDTQIMSLRVNKTLLTIFEKVFRSNRGWRTNIPHMFLAVFALRLENDLTLQPQSEYYPHTASTLFSSLRYVAGRSAKAHALIEELSKDSTALLAKGRAKTLIRKAYSEFVSRLESEPDLSELGANSDEIIYEEEL